MIRKSKEYISLRCTKSCFAGGSVRAGERGTDQTKLHFYDDSLSRAEK